MDLRIDHINVVKMSGDRARVTTSYGKRRSRVYVWPVGETILENLQNRRNRPVADYRRVVTKELRDAGLHGELKWSQKAGCGCGCSPGFVYEAPIYVDERPCDIHVHVRAK